MEDSRCHVSCQLDFLLCTLLTPDVDTLQLKRSRASESVKHCSQQIFLLMVFNMSVEHILDKHFCNSGRLVASLRRWVGLFQEKLDLCQKKVNFLDLNLSPQHLSCISYHAQTWTFLRMGGSLDFSLSACLSFCFNCLVQDIRIRNSAHI